MFSMINDGYGITWRDFGRILTIPLYKDEKNRTQPEKKSIYPSAAKSDKMEKFFDAENAYVTYIQFMKNLVTKDKVKENKLRLKTILEECLSPVSSVLAETLAKENDSEKCRKIILDEINIGINEIKLRQNKNSGSAKKYKPVTDSPDDYPSVQESLAKEKFYKAELAKAKYLLRVGEYVDAGPVNKDAAMRAGSVLKSLKGSPIRLKNLVWTENDPEKIKDLIDQEIRSALGKFNERVTYG